MAHCYEPSIPEAEVGGLLGKNWGTKPVPGQPWLYNQDPNSKKRDKMATFQVSVMVLTVTPALEAEARGLLQVQGQPGLHSEIISKQIAASQHLATYLNIILRAARGLASASYP